jgi:fumarylacetoacetate (FAA) hydrolase
MKLATLRNGRPDGQLVVVNGELTHYVSAGRVAPTLQAALDAWETAAPALGELSRALNAGSIAGQPFEPSFCMAPLPRAYQWIDGSGYLGHLERVRSLEGTPDPGPAARRPLLYQGGSDAFLGPTDPIVMPEADLGLDFEAELAAILGPVPMRPDKGSAAAAIRLLTVCNDVSLRRLVADDLERGFGFFHAKPATSFAPVAATPDEFGERWSGNRLSLRVQASVNGRLYGQPNAGIGMQFDFADMIVAAAQTRRLGTGTILGSGTIANRHDDTLPIKRDGIGFACIAEARAMEKEKYGRARTPFLAPGDRVRIAAVDDDDRPVFGAIDQEVALLRP